MQNSIENNTNNRWEVDDEVRKVLPKIVEFIEKIETNSNNENKVLDLTYEKINPYQLYALLGEVGYQMLEKIKHNDMDFSIYLVKNDCKPLKFNVFGATFELSLSQHFYDCEEL